ncbi:SDR family oxidoreductase [Paraburkholderia dipogonis]|nr:SDR family oxidoreductase [Paraburkholderia dipogonis]
MKTVVVAGAVGIIGRAVISHFDQVPNAKVIAVSRRKPDYPTKAEHIPVDLLDAESCRALLANRNDITHIVHAAYQEKQTQAEQVGPNLAMLENLVRAVADASPRLRHVTLMQGTKAYGPHLGAFSTPAKESDSRHMPPNFYYNQEDFLRAASKEASWTWTALRPAGVIGMAVGNPMNLLMVISVYAVISKALGLPLVFPGTWESYQSLFQVTDARLLARATEWAGEEPACAGQTYNITNGDFFRWSRVWPVIAKFFQMEVGAPLAISLNEMMADKGDLWSKLVDRFDLLPTAFENLARWGYGDFVFKAPYDNLSTTIKARKAGFQDCIDTDEMFIEFFTMLQNARVIPKDLSKLGPV